MGQPAIHNFNNVLLTGRYIRESPPQFENQIMAWVYVSSITRSTMYQKAPFYLQEMAHRKLAL